MVIHKNINIQIRAKGVDEHPGIGYTRCIVNPIFDKVLHITDIWESLDEIEQIELLDELNGELNETEVL